VSSNAPSKRADQCGIPGYINAYFNLSPVLADMHKAFGTPCEFKFSNDLGSGASPSLGYAASSEFFDDF